MKLATVGIEVGAWRKESEYERVVRSAKVTEHDRAVLAAYKAAREGKRVIDLVDVMRVAGLRDGLPALAIARADATWCRFRVSGDRAVFTASTDRGWTTGGFRVRDVVKVPARVLRFSADGLQRCRDNTFAALMPSIPPDLRPGKSALSTRYVLWEADWSAVPHDPALLRHLGGTLYAVEAEWDLTPIERAALSVML